MQVNFYVHCNRTRHKLISSLEKLLRKLFYPDIPASDDRVIEMLNVYREEFRWFTSRLQCYDDESIWSEKHNANLEYGRSHFWHQQHSLDCTKYLGKLACKVCSKIVGIGSAERNWKSVTHLKTGKRANLSAEKVKMAGTVYGTAKIQEARALEIGNPESNAVLWEDADLNDDFDLFLSGVKPAAEQTKTFRCYLEEWEHHAIFAKDPPSVAKLLCKYGGMIFYDIDQRVHLEVVKEALHWERPGTKQGERHGGHHLICKPARTAAAEADGRSVLLPIQKGADIYYLIKKTDPELNPLVTLELDQYVALEHRDTDYEDSDSDEND